MTIIKNIILDNFLYKSKWDIYKIYNIIRDDYIKFSYKYDESKDQQLFDYSYEYNYKEWIIKNNIVRFSYFWTKIDFIDKLSAEDKQELGILH